MEKENEELKNKESTPNPTDNNLKEDNEKLIEENNELEKENKKLKQDLKKSKGLQKIVDALRMNRREQIKSYQTESYSLDYLRPRDFEDDKIKKDTYKVKRPSKNYAFKPNNKKEDNKIEDKSKSERAALAIMRIRQAQEQKRKNDD